MRKLLSSKDYSEVFESIIKILEDKKCTLSDFDRVSNRVREHYLKNAILKNTIGSKITLDLDVKARVHKPKKES